MAVQVFSGRLSVDPRRLELHPQQHLRHLFGDYQLLSVTTSSRPVTLAALAVPPLTRGFLKPQGRFLATPFHGQAMTCSGQAMLAPASMSTEAGWNRRFWAIHGWGTWGRPQSMACSLRLTMPYHALPCLSSHCGQSCWDDLKLSNDVQWTSNTSMNAANIRKCRCSLLRYNCLVQELDATFQEPHSSLESTKPQLRLKPKDGCPSSKHMVWPHGNVFQLLLSSRFSVWL